MNTTTIDDTQRYRTALQNRWQTLLAPLASTRNTSSMQVWSKCGLYRVVRVAFRLWLIYQHPTPKGAGAVVVATIADGDAAHIAAAWMARVLVEPVGGES